MMSCSHWGLFEDAPEHRITYLVGEYDLGTEVNKAVREHWSSCATHNAPALPVGPCDCGGYVGYDSRYLHDHR